MKSDVTTHLQHQADAIRKGAELIVESINDWQVIRQFLSNRTKDIELTESQQLKLDRYNFMYNQLASGRYTEAEVVHMNSKINFVSLPQSYEDLNCTKELFAILFNFNKAFELRLQLDLNRIMLNQAQAERDYKAYAMLERNRVKLMDLLPEMEQEENYFESHQNLIEFNPELVGGEEVDMKAVLDYINDKRNTKIRTELFDEAETLSNDSKEAALQ